MKKLISVFCAVVLLLSVLAVPASAQEENGTVTTEKPWWAPYWEHESVYIVYGERSGMAFGKIPGSSYPDGWYLYDSYGLKGDIVVPDTINGSPVVGLYYCNFNGPATADRYYVFELCPEMTSVTFPATLKDFKIETEEAISGGIFSSCSGLKEIVFRGDGPEMLPDGFFIDAYSLERVVLPKKVKAMDGAFQSYITSKSEQGPNGLRPVFTSHPLKVTELVLDSANPYFIKDSQGAVYNKEMTKLITAVEGAENRTEFALPDTVTEIAPHAFAGNTRLQKIYGGSHVEKTGESVILGCTALNPFEDTYGHWSEEYAKWAFQNDLFAGTGAFSFSPDNKMTRGMVAAVLYRLEGEPSQSGNIPFGDVSATAYYAKAALWASKNSIVYGYDSKTFAPNDSITREQMACMLYRYAKLKGEVSPGTALDEFTDADKVHDWAQEAMQWAVGEGIISGMGNGKLNPRGTATRAEVATVLKNFKEA